jgi:glycosyltransferase involved in cell wall biosynthesis
MKTEQKHILMFVSNGFDPDPRVHKEARSLITHGFKVTIICWDRKQNLKQKETIDGIQILRIRTGNVTSGSACSMMLHLPRFHHNAYQLAKKIRFDAVHCHDFDTVMIGHKLKKKFGVPLVYDIHDLYYTWFHNSSKLLQPLARAIQQADLYYAKKADQVITVTESIGLAQEGLKEYYIKKGVPAKKIMVLWNYPSQEAMQDIQKITPKEKTICYIGNIRTSKSFELLFEAIQKSKEAYSALIVGDGHQLATVKQLAKEKNIKATFPGKVPYNKIANYYAQAIVSFSVMGKRENDKRAISVKTFEAAYYGVPIICSEHTLDADFVTAYKLGKTCAFTAKSMQQALKEIKPITKKKFVWEQQEQKLIDTYRSIL